MLYLVDASCNINLVSKRKFDRLPKHNQDQRMACDMHGQMAGGTRLPFYKVVLVPIKVRDVQLKEIFAGGQINKEAFLANHDCRMNFTRLMVTVRERELELY